MLNKTLPTIILTVFLMTPVSSGEILSSDIKGKPLDFSDYIIRAAEADTEFDEILIDHLILNYQKSLRLPASDIVLSVKEQYHYFIESDKSRGETEVSLSKLFPMSGTKVEAIYESNPVSAIARNNTTTAVEITQSIAENAFGRSVRLLDSIIGLEVDIARHQVTEAYEEYLAFVSRTYFSWYESYRNLEISISSYKENSKLLTNIKERQKSNIALPIDVNKVEIQLLDKQESLRSSFDAYIRQTNLIYRVLRSDGTEKLMPAEFSYTIDFNGGFISAYDAFRSDSRTSEILRLLDEKSGLQLDRDADDLLPSIDLFVGYEVEGTDFGLDDNNRLFYAGIQMDWPLPDTVEQAEHEISRINRKKTGYTVQNTHHRLFTQLKNIYQEIDREQKLLEIAEKKISLAESVLEDETENYSFGKVSLNDYIQAVNALDDARFNHVRREVNLKRLILEWKRISDTLISAEDIQKKPSI